MENLYLLYEIISQVEVIIALLFAISIIFGIIAVINYFMSLTIKAMLDTMLKYMQTKH